MADQMNEVNEPFEGPLEVNIGNIADGAALAAFEAELRKCLDNIYDLNTPATATRTVTLKFKLKPSHDRVQIDTEFSCDSSLPGPVAKTGRIFAVRDEDGGLHAVTKDPRQIALFQTPAPREVPAPIAFKTANS